jgi:hypothetical protein
MDAKTAQQNRLIALQNGEKTYEGRPCKKCGCKHKVAKWSECVDCRRAKGLAKLNDSKLMAKYRTPEKELAKQRKWRQANPDKVKAQTLRASGYQREHYLANKEYHVDRGLKANYGISLTEYNELLQKQNDKCAICQRDSSLFKKKLAVDHCHKTNKIRGLLCKDCNIGLGMFFDETDRMEKAINYLRESIR